MMTFCTYAKRFVCVQLLLAISCLAVAQEVCNNGIDDDSDGLTDLQDPDCQCHFVVNGNLLQNASFESYTHCPTIYTYDSNATAALYWQYGSYTNISETNYYHSLTCSYDSAIVMVNMPPKLPLPDGKAFISIINGVPLNPIPEKQIPKSYVGQCLQAPLVPGEQYTLSFYAGRFRSWDNYNGKLFPFTVALFGNADCNAVPFGQKYASGSGCPTNYAGWVFLGKTIVLSYGDWVQTKINFTVPTNINLIEIGPDCAILPSIIDLTDSTTFLDYHQYYLDDLHLLPTKYFPFEYIHALTESECNGDLELEAPETANASYQWYADSIAIQEATGLTYKVPTLTKGTNFNVRITTSDKCIITEPFFVAPGNLDKINIPKDSFICNMNTPIVLAPALEGISYTINGENDTSVIITHTGNYNIIATDSYGCQKTFNTVITQQNCTDCDASVPTAFTPNGDGLNDLFKPKLFCNFSDYYFEVFNRWGKKIFESRDINHGWDGTYLGNKVLPGVYIYFMHYKTGSQKNKIAKGTLTLIR